MLGAGYRGARCEPPRTAACPARSSVTSDVAWSCVQVVRVLSERREDTHQEATGAAQSALSSVCRADHCLVGWDVVAVPTGDGDAVSDVVFVVLTLVVFGLLALVGKGTEKL